ncbi:MAG: MoaD/ThiS family protein [Planctomycetota bacterium]
MQLFAGAREAAGVDALVVELSADATYRDLSRAIAASHPALERLVAASRFAAGTSYASAGDLVDPSVEISLIPPVSGG